MQTLEYPKMILQKVSFDKVLFEKEYKKALHSLPKRRRKPFFHWVIQKFDEPIIRTIRRSRLGLRSKSLN